MSNHRTLPGRACGAASGLLASILLFTAHAEARVHVASPWQSLPTPLNSDPNGPVYVGASDVAIDGDSIIATFASGDSQTAALYRRDTTDHWNLVGTLASGTTRPTSRRR